MMIIDDNCESIDFKSNLFTLLHWTWPAKPETDPTLVTTSTSWSRTCFLNSWHSSGVIVSALAMRGMMFTFSCNLFMNSISRGFSLERGSRGGETDETLVTADGSGLSRAVGTEWVKRWAPVTQPARDGSHVSWLGWPQTAHVKWSRQQRDRSWLESSFKWHYSVLLLFVCFAARASKKCSI